MKDTPNDEDRDLISECRRDRRAKVLNSCCQIIRITSVHE